MFGQPKPLASLSSTLLARKGQARPAMRPQGFGGFGAIPGAHDDLGWNDMGHGEAHQAPEPVYAPPVMVPPVLRQREALQEEFETPAAFGEPEEFTATEPVEAAQPIEPEPVAESEPEPAPVVAPRAAAPVVTVSPATAARVARETQTKQPKAAFTLRLDYDRHLRLRLASACLNTSAQALVTEALDALLQSLPEVEDLVRQLPPRASI